jgi:heme-degrading monooxygenase HmoA
MILEVAILFVRKGQCENFETDFGIASKYISGIPGYISHDLKKCLEQENKYILLVKWNDLEAHTIRFRGSEAYLEWKRLLHHYYDPFPVVEHYETVFGQDY